MMTKNEFKWTGIILLVPTILSSLVLGLFGLLALMSVGEGDDVVNFNYTIVYVSAGLSGIGLFFYAMWFWMNMIANNYNDDFWKEVTELTEERKIVQKKYDDLVVIATKYKDRARNILDKEFELKKRELIINDKEEKLTTKEWVTNRK